jgi:hypothetical protein
MRAVYLLRLKGYASTFMALVQELREKTIELQQGLPPRVATLAASGEQLPNLDKTEQQASVDAHETMSQLGRDYAAKLVEQIQLEEGEYELTVTVLSRPLNLFRKIRHRDSSSIAFSVEKTARDSVKAALPKALYTEMWNAVFGGSLAVASPEYSPKDRREL